MAEKMVEGRADSSPVKPTRNYEHCAARKGDVGMNDNRTDPKKAAQNRSDDVDTRFMELLCRLSNIQKCAVVVSIVLSAVAGGQISGGAEWAN